MSIYDRNLQMPVRHYGGAGAGLGPPSPGPSYRGLAGEYSNRAIHARGMMKPDQKTETDEAGATMGGALAAGVGGAAAGAQIGTMVSTSSSAGPYGAMFGAFLGIMSYLASQ
jgi:hypothetical protein